MLTRGAALVLALALAACAAERPAEVLPGAETSLPKDRQADCPPPALGSAFDETMPGAGRHDAVRLDRSILHAVNRARCARNLSPLVAERSLRHAAELHNRDMVRLGFYDHRSPVPGREEISDRLQLVGVPFQRAAENLLQTWFMAYEDGREYQVLDAVRCEFAYTDGSPIVRHSYASFGREAVASWLDSPGHAHNLLDPNLGRHGAALIPNGETALCGGAFVTQVFAG